MRNELKHIEEIERYLTQKMSGEELSAFEQKLKVDDGLRFDVKLQQQLTTEIRVDAFKKEALAFHETFVATSLKSKSWKYFLNSLFVVGAVGFGFFIFHVITTNKNDRESKYTTARGMHTSNVQTGLWIDTNHSGSALLASNESTHQNTSTSFTSYSSFTPTSSKQKGNRQTKHFSDSGLCRTRSRFSGSF